MIQGISYWSFEDGVANTHPLDDALQRTKEAGFEALELGISTEGVITTASSQSECEAVRRQIDASGLHVSTVASGMSWGTNPVSDDEAVREQSNEQVEAALERTAWLGCEAFLYVPGVVGSPIAPDEKVRYDHAIARCRDNVRQLLRTAERVGVDLCIENVWNGMFLSPLELIEFLDDIGSPRLGVYLDVGNLLGYHQNPPHWIELLGSRIKRVHVKGFRHTFGWEGSYSFCRLGRGDVPWRPTVAALQAIGYDKTVIAEMLPPAPGLVEQTAADMKSVLR